MSLSGPGADRFIAFEFRACNRARAPRAGYNVFDTRRRSTQDRGRIRMQRDRARLFTDPLGCTLRDYSLQFDRQIGRTPETLSAMLGAYVSRGGRTVDAHERSRFAFTISYYAKTSGQHRISAAIVDFNMPKGKCSFRGSFV